ncbi:MAG: hypothetical protein Q8O12_06785 [Candidatus Omnitrophota bacterium]|nr:hypothetical protein [Candidatus Omnitrophota bacterium]
MEKNRNNYCQRMLALIFAATFTAVMYVNQQALIYQMGLKLKTNSDIYTKLVDHNKILVYNVLNLSSPVTLERRLLAKEVELSMPSKWHVVKNDHSPKKVVLNSKELAKKGPLSNLFAKGR